MKIFFWKSRDLRDISVHLEILTYIVFEYRMFLLALLAPLIACNVIKHHRELTNDDDILVTALNSSVILGEFLQKLSKKIKNVFRW